MDPWPRAYTFWHRPEGPPTRLILGPAAVVEAAAPAARPGTVLEAADGRLTIAAGRERSNCGRSSRRALGGWKSRSFSADIASARATDSARKNCPPRNRPLCGKMGCFEERD